MPETLRSTHREIQALLDEKVRYPIDLFGGDSWQMYLPDPTVALAAVTRFRAALFADHGIHTRMVIAIDRIDFLNTENLSESDGQAFRRSGRALQQMRGDRMEVLVPELDDPAAEIAAQAIARSVDYITRSWTRAQAQAVKHMIDCQLANRSCSQAEIGRRWQPAAISQQAVARHLQSAGWDNVEASLTDFARLITSVAKETGPTTTVAEDPG